MYKPKSLEKIATKIFVKLCLAKSVDFGISELEHLITKELDKIWQIKEANKARYCDIIKRMIFDMMLHPNIKNVNEMDDFLYKIYRKLVEQK